MKNLKSSVSNMGICNAQQQKDNACRNSIKEARLQGKDAFWHRTMVASHTVVPLGTAKWLV